MNENVLVSVIIPVYNVKDYLIDCLDSVATQSFANKEVILVDDGSTDNSGHICDVYATKHKDFRVIHKTNGGLSSARNRGIEEAHGKWLIFLDSDDVWSDHDCLQKLYSYAEKLTLDVLRFEYQVVNEKLEYIEPRNYDKSNIEGRVLNNYELVNWGISGEWFAVLYLLRKEAISSFKFNEHTKFQEDIDFYSRLFASRELRCGYLDERMYLYRKRTASITTTARISNLEGSFSLCDVFYNESLKINDKRLKQLYIYNSVMMYYWTLQTVATEAFYPKRKEIVEQLGINDLRENASIRKKQTPIPCKYLPFIYLSPAISIWLIRNKNILVQKIK